MKVELGVARCFILQSQGHQLAPQKNSSSTNSLPNLGHNQDAKQMHMKRNTTVSAQVFRYLPFMVTCMKEFNE